MIIVVCSLFIPVSALVVRHCTIVLDVLCLIASMRCMVLTQSIRLKPIGIGSRLVVSCTGSVFASLLILVISLVFRLIFRILKQAK